MRAQREESGSAAVVKATVTLAANMATNNTALMAPAHAFAKEDRRRRKAPRSRWRE